MKSFIAIGAKYNITTEPLNEIKYNITVRDGCDAISLVNEKSLLAVSD